MNKTLSIIASIEESDPAYVIIALIAIAILWFVFKKKNNKQE